MPVTPSDKRRRSPAGRVERCLVAVGLCLGLLACRRGEPPGADRPVAVVVVRAGAVDEHVAEANIEAPPSGELGTQADNLPFQPSGEKLASIAWRTWVYTDTGPKRHRYGYLRAGAVVDRRGPPIVNDGCAGGWYRINPRGFVCVGKGATLDLNHPVVVASGRRPKRGDGLPYVYALSQERAPHYYFRLPTHQEMRSVEGDDTRSRALRWRSHALAHDFFQRFEIAPQPPAFLSQERPTPKPYGAERRLHYSVHSGRASSDSGFAMLSLFEWEGRAFGLTTALDIIPLDRTKLIAGSSFRGVELGPGEDLPVAIVRHASATSYEQSGGQLKGSGSYAKRTVLKLTGKVIDDVGRYWETSDGTWVHGSALTMLNKRKSFPSFATGTRKWVDISIKKQTLVAYVGNKAVYASLVSTGAGGMGDPEEVPATIRGTFMIHSKHVSSTMDGEEDKSDSFNLQDVPFVQYFHKGFALHGTYWHDQFGRIRSHGCVNLAPMDAAWLFEWTDPHVPVDWHAMINKERGTVVYIRP